MSKQVPKDRRTIRGTIRRRLLVNALVDPDEAAGYLPGGLRPCVIEGGTVVGCCLLEVDHIRPAFAPDAFGITLRAAAHRIAVAWEDERGVPTVGVYVPVRHTDSSAAVMLGGRWFPGVHRRAIITVFETSGRVDWRVESSGGTGGFGIGVTASISPEEPSTPCEPIGAHCLGASVGLSPDHHGEFEGALMEPDHRRVQRVVVEHLESEFLAAFTTARPAPSYLLRDVGVTWRPAQGVRASPDPAMAGRSAAGFGRALLHQ